MKFSHLLSALTFSAAQVQAAYVFAHVIVGDTAAHTVDTWASGKSINLPQILEDSTCTDTTTRHLLRRRLRNRRFRAEHRLWRFQHPRPSSKCFLRSRISWQHLQALLLIRLPRRRRRMARRRRRNIHERVQILGSLFPLHQPPIRLNLRRHRQHRRLGARRHHQSRSR